VSDGGFLIGWRVCVVVGQTGRRSIGRHGAIQDHRNIAGLGQVAERAKVSGASVVLPIVRAAPGGEDDRHAGVRIRAGRQRKADLVRRDGQHCARTEGEKQQRAGEHRHAQHQRRKQEKGRSTKERLAASSKKKRSRSQSTGFEPVRGDHT
jgi:hypothetical protein